MAGYFENPEATGADDHRRLAAHRRPRPVRRGGQPLHRRPQEGDDPRRDRRERLSRRARGAVRRLASTSRRCQRRRAAAARAATRRSRRWSCPTTTTTARSARTCARPCASTSRRSARRCRSTSASRSSTCGTSICRRRRRARSSAARSIKELQRLERAAKGGAEAKQLAAGGDGGGTWLHDVLADVSQKKRGDDHGARRALDGARLRLADVHRARGRARGGRRGPAGSGGAARARDRRRRREARRAHSARRREREAEARSARARRRTAEEKTSTTTTSTCRAPLVALGRRALRGGMRALYERVLETDIYGRRNVPPFGGYIVAANHASHLDTGLVKYALGEQGEALVALAREGLLLRGSGPPDVLRELHEPRADGAPRLAARVAAARRRGDPRRLHPADLPRGHAQRDRRDGRLQAVARLPRDDEQVRHPADVPVAARTRRCRRAATCRSAASASRRTSARILSYAGRRRSSPASASRSPSSTARSRITSRA